jgi:PIN domain nuclease of toxin-antitoxin system
MAQALQHEQTIGVSSITLAEIVYLVKKARVLPDAFRELCRVLVDPDEVLIELPMSQPIAACMQQIPRSEVRDLPDRIVAATALCYGVPVISRDRRIRASNVQTIW